MDFLPVVDLSAATIIEALIAGGVILATVNFADWGSDALAKFFQGKP